MFDDPKLHVCVDGTKEWFLDGRLHRADGPAVEWKNGANEWRLNGKLHRVNGPAVDRADGTNGWWLDGVSYSEEEHYFQVMMRYPDV